MKSATETLEHPFIKAVPEVSVKVLKDTKAALEGLHSDAAQRKTEANPAPMMITLKEVQGLCDQCNTAQKDVKAILAIVARSQPIQIA